MRQALHRFGLRFQLSVCISVLLLVLVTAKGWAQDRPLPRGAPCDPCDVNCDLVHDELDIAPFVDALVNGVSGCSACGGDFDGGGFVDGLDIQPFADCLLAPPPLGACCEPPASCFLATETDCQGAWLGPESLCNPDPCVAGQMTAYRPQHGSGYFPFSKTAVPDANEESTTLGPGIRINHPGDGDPVGEDDLIEVAISIDTVGAQLALRRSSGNLKAWTTRAKNGGTEIPFVSDKTGPLPFGPGETELTVWVEWAVAAHGTADLHLEPLAISESLDMLRFHSFQSIVMALGGETQTPSIPIDSTHGTFIIAVSLYGQGYDVHMHDEDDVSADGSGVVYNEVVTAVQNRIVDEVGIFGYSHGGGSTYDLSDRLDMNRAGIGVFDIVFTSYVDGVSNDSDFDMFQETRRPPSTDYHANHYQVGSLIDIFLDGGPVPNSDPPPTGLNVETTPWGALSTHYDVDDFVQVRDFIEANLLPRVMP